MLPIYKVKPSINLNQEILQGEKIMVYEENVLNGNKIRTLVMSSRDRTLKVVIISSFYFIDTLETSLDSSAPVAICYNGS